jgi:hypothetical protein
MHHNQQHHPQNIPHAMAFTSINLLVGIGSPLFSASCCLNTLVVDL